ncbi:MAG: MMPL family transporter [Sphingomonadales bacterium]|nr:MMPL family transporter [Sphingomonadales bacterium]
MARFSLHERLKSLILGAASRPWLTVGVALACVIAAAFVVVLRFDMTTDTGEMISPKTAWRQNEIAVEKAFTNTQGTIVVIVDGQTPELAEAGAKALAEAAVGDRKHFWRVERPDAGPFLSTHGLLFADLPDVKDTTRRLIDAQPLLGALAGDPSLRGVAKAIDTAADGAAREADIGQTARLAGPLNALSTAIDAKLAGQARYFSWQRLFASGKGPLAPPTRRLVTVEPVLDFGDLQPGSAATEALMAAAAKLGLDAAHGVHVGLTGEIPLADEEFGTIEDNIGVVGAIMALAMVVTLWFATRSARIVTAIMLTIVAGLVVTLGLGLLAVGRLNLISIAFIPLFVGLGVDFGIQVSVRFNAERRGGAEPMAALGLLAEAIGEPLLMAAAAILLALGAFLPTDYIGIAELGVIAGMGMMIALLLNLTLLPALLVLLKPAPPAGAVGWARAAPIDAWLHHRRKAVIWAFVLAMIASIAGLAAIRFDFNPLHLRDPQTPAMRGLADLLRDPDRTPNTLSVLAPDLASADRLAARLGKLPEVSQAVTLSSFIPADQPAKLALIEDAALLLDPAINPFDFPPPPDDAAAVAALRKAAGSLRALAMARPGELGGAAGGLAARFDRLASASASRRAGVEAMLVQPLGVTLDTIRTSLQATAVTRETLPPAMVAEWVAKDGRALVSLTPAGNSLDNATLERFTAAVRAVAPNATGMPVATQEAARTVATAFVQAGVLALVLVSLLLWAALRSAKEVAYTLAPVVLSIFLTLGSCVVIGQPLNFANIIAFPLLFGVGVAFHIYFVMAWRRGVGDLLQTSLARAVVFSALATGSAFGALWLSDHPGTASMGLILMISLIWTLICALVFEPALLGPVRHHDANAPEA